MVTLKFCSQSLVNYFKSASANKKIGIASTGIVLGAAFSPLIVLATLIALVAIGARYVGIGIGKAGEKIKEGVIEAGKAVKSSYKDLIDKLPTIQARENNFDKFKNDLSGRTIEIGTAQKREETGEDETKNNLSNMLEVVKMLQNKEAGLLNNLMSKGTSTHEEDMEKLVDFMSEFQPAIMAIGSDIKEVEQKVNEKVQEIKPDSQLGSSSAERVSEEGIIGPGRTQKLLLESGVTLLLFIHFFEQSTSTSNTHLSDYNIQFLIMFFYR